MTQAPKPLQATQSLIFTDIETPWLGDIKSLDVFEPVAKEFTDTDAAWVYRYLCNGVNSPNSRRAVQGEMLRLAWFMNLHAIPRLSALTSDHAALYRQWLGSVKTSDQVSSASTPRQMNGALSPDWRPFRQAEPLSENSIKTALRLISGCLAFMQDAPECSVSGNPFRRIGKKLAGKKAVDDFNSEDALYEKALSLNAFNALTEYLHLNPERKTLVARRWLVTLLYSTAVRVETLVALRSSNLVPSDTVPGQWQLVFIAKGNRQVRQIWTEDQMSGLVEYRHSLGMQWPPGIDEPSYLWCGTGRSDQNPQGCVSADSVRSMIKTIGSHVAAWVALYPYESAAFDIAGWREKDTRQLNEFHPHTLRHSWCSHALNHHDMDLFAVQDHMGHSSVTITERYRDRHSNV